MYIGELVDKSHDLTSIWRDYLVYSSIYSLMGQTSASSLINKAHMTCKTSSVLKTLLA